MYIYMDNEIKNDESIFLTLFTLRTSLKMLSYLQNALLWMTGDNLLLNLL